VHRDVCRFLEVDPQQVLSSRRNRNIVFARARIVLRVVGCRVASREVAARYLKRTPADLQLLVRRHRERYSIFFDVDRFPVGGPVIPLAQSQTREEVANDAPSADSLGIDTDA
jgi:hypothetical protein